MRGNLHQIATHVLRVCKPDLAGGLADPGEHSPANRYVQPVSMTAGVGHPCALLRGALYRVTDCRCIVKRAAFDLHLRKRRSADICLLCLACGCHCEIAQMAVCFTQPCVQHTHSRGGHFQRQWGLARGLIYCCVVLYRLDAGILKHRLDVSCGCVGDFCNLRNDLIIQQAAVLRPEDLPSGGIRNDPRLDEPPDDIADNGLIQLGVQFNHIIRDVIKINGIQH